MTTQKSQIGTHLGDCENARKVAEIEKSLHAAGLTWSDLTDMKSGIDDDELVLAFTFTKNAVGAAVGKELIPTAKEWLAERAAHQRAVDERHYALLAKMVREAMQKAAVDGGDMYIQRCFNVDGRAHEYTAVAVGYMQLELQAKGFEVIMGNPLESSTLFSFAPKKQE